MMLWRFFVYQMPLQSLAPVNFSTAFVNSLKGELWKDPKNPKRVYFGQLLLKANLH